jgi:hypothetical protein
MRVVRECVTQCDGFVVQICESKQRLDLSLSRFFFSHNKLDRKQTTRFTCTC